MKIKFTSDGAHRSVERDTALCVFRIVQESLRDVKKHSGATDARVDLSVSGNKLSLVVEDYGCGFDLTQSHCKEGLRIRSMGERARVLGGEFKIRSAWGKGTTVKVWVPLKRASPGYGVDREESMG